MKSDADVFVDAVADGSRVLLAGDRGPDCYRSRLVPEIAERLGGRAEVTALRCELSAAHELKMDDKYHAVLLSVCRCMDCTIVAWTLYGRHVHADGIMAVTDTNPMAAWVGWHQGHGPKHRAYGVSTRAALARLELLDGVHPRWRVEVDHYDTATELGGVMILKRRF